MTLDYGMMGFAVQALCACLIALGLLWLVGGFSQSKLLVIPLLGNLAWALVGLYQLIECFGVPVNDPNSDFIVAMVTFSRYASLLFLLVAVGASIRVWSLLRESRRARQ